MTSASAHLDAEEIRPVGRQRPGDGLGLSALEPANLLAKEREFGAGAVEFGGEPEPGHSAVKAPASGAGEGHVGQGDDMQHRGADVGGASPWAGSGRMGLR